MPTPSCSGTLVAPRVVLTAAHCVGGTTWGVVFSPVVPDGSAGGPAGQPPGTPAPYCVNAVGCATHPGYGAPCGAGQTGSSPFNGDRDVAMLVLDARMDHGVRGTRTQSYHVVPASIVPHDDSCIGSLGVESPVCWNNRSVLHVGYGPTSGCWVPPGPAGPRPAIRQVGGRHVEFGDWTISINFGSGIVNLSSSMALYGASGLQGDSGGSVYLDEGEDNPRRLLGMWRGFIAYDAFPYCVPEPSLVRDHVVRLTHSSIQGFTAPFFNATVGPTTPGVSLWNTGVPPLWTGDVDVPPRTEPAERAAFVDPLGRSAETLDPDGDGMVGPRDNCWGISNIEQRVADASMTLRCPRARADGTFGTYTCLDPMGGTAELDIDPDNDGIPVGCDNCPIANPGQGDCDGDGIGDDCRCGLPGVADDFCEEHTDSDTTPDECDNCIDVPNDQRDCNLDAEMAVPGTPILGDMCDPTPCTGGWIENRPTGAGRIANVIVAVDPAGTTPGPFRSGFRFCPCSIARNTPASRLECEDPLPDLSGECAIATPGLYVPLTSSEPFDWRFPTLSAPELDPAGEVSLEHDAPLDVVLTASWDVSGADRPRWSMGAFATRYPADVPSSTPIRGVFWMRTIDVAPFDDRLTNHYTSGLIAESAVATGESLLPPLREEEAVPIIPLPMDNDFCPFCGDWLPIPWLMYPCFDPRTCDSIDSGTPKIALGDRILTPGVEPVLDPPGFGLFALEEPARWVAVPEPIELAPAGSLRFIALDAQSASPMRLLSMRNGALIHFGQQQQCPQGQCDPFPALAAATPPMALSDLSLARSAPIARADYSLAASAHWASAWIAGGRDAAGGQLHDIWRFAAVSREWARLEITGVSLGRVLALAYAPLEGVLYVLDDTDDRPRGMVRLVRIPPEGGAARVEAAWPRTHELATAVLAADPDGRVWLGASQPGRGAHAVARLSRGADGNLHFDGMVRGAGSLTRDGAYASARGLSLAVEIDHHAEIVGYTTADLVPRGSTERCF